MKLFLSRDTSMSHSRFLVTDESGNRKYVVTGKGSASIERLVISDTQGQMLVTIRVSHFSFFSAFVVSDYKERFSMVAGRNRAEYKFHGISWTLCRSRDVRSFEIFDADGTSVMLQLADNFIRKGYYELNIFSEQRELFCIAAAICADTINLADTTVAATV